MTLPTTPDPTPTPAQVLELVATLLGSKAQVERLHGENNLFSHPDFERIQVEAREAAARFYALDPATLRAQAAALAEREAEAERLRHELETAQVFHDHAVAQRDAAWHQIDILRGARGVRDAK